VAAAFEPARRLVGLQGREEPAAAEAEEHYSLRRLRVQPPHTLALSSFVTRRGGRGVKWITGPTGNILGGGWTV
jgi:hypothetical protein